jgi:hypothetical protein
MGFLPLDCAGGRADVVHSEWGHLLLYTECSQARGIVVAEALCYKPDSRGFETRCGEFFSIYLILPAALGPAVYSASNRNECQKQKNNASGE